jgi:hypothetical protein
LVAPISPKRYDGGDRATEFNGIAAHASTNALAEQIRDPTPPGAW